MKKVIELRQEFISLAQEKFDRIVRKCDSPIEAAMAGALLVDGFEFPHQIAWCELADAAKTLRASSFADSLVSDRELWGVLLHPLVQFDGFKITPDFGLICPLVNGVIGVAVELDGHEFHERTKEQASRDKRRDRALHSAGWSVIRFSGSDVHRDPFAVLDEWRVAMTTEYSKRTGVRI